MTSPALPRLVIELRDVGREWFSVGQRLPVHVEDRWSLWFTFESLDGHRSVDGMTGTKAEVGAYEKALLDAFEWEKA